MEEFEIVSPFASDVPTDGNILKPIKQDNKFLDSTKQTFLINNYRRYVDTHTFGFGFGAAASQTFEFMINTSIKITELFKFTVISGGTATLTINMYVNDMLLYTNTGQSFVQDDTLLFLDTVILGQSRIKWTATTTDVNNQNPAVFTLSYTGFLIYVDPEQLANLK